MAISDDLAAYIVTREFQLLRVAAGLQKDALSALEELESDIVDKINRAAGKSDMTQARLKALLDQTQRSITKAYKDLAAQNSEDLGQIASTEANGTADWINGELSVQIMTVAASDEQLQAVADKTLILGHYGKDLWEQQGQATQDRFTAQMRLGVLSGESIGQLVSRVRGTKAMGYADGIMAVSRRHAETLVRTSVISVANEARLQMYRDNSDVVKGIQWVSTLDSRTTIICMGLDGCMWDLNFNPIGHSKAWPGPTAHPNCRSTQISVLKSWQELADEGSMSGPRGGSSSIENEIDREAQAKQWTAEQTAIRKAQSRASMNGQVAGNLNYEDFLRSQGKTFQDEVLGPGRASLWRDGKVTLQEMTNQANRPLTIEQLKSK